MTVHLLLLVLSALCLAPSLLAQGPVSTRLADVRRLINGEQIAYDSVFAKDFLAKVPPMQLQAGVSGLVKSLGTCTDITITEQRSPVAAKAEAVMSGGFVIPVTINVEALPPHRIDGLFLRSPVKRGTSLDAVIEDLRSLPGSTSLLAMNLTKGTVLAAKDTSLTLPIGSTFKLYILGELARSIDARTRTWGDVVLLDSMRMSLPSGVMQSWPHGAPVTLHTLATNMISISDNTATDHLLFLVGRENVEKQQATMGHTDPARNRPFMSTHEMFRLKFTNEGRPAHRYASLDEAGRRSMLRDLEASAGRDTVEFVDSVMLPDKVEWFARTPDLVRAMDWFRRQTASNPTAPVMGVLAVNPGVEIDKNTWTYAGYKGGSETGVLNMTYLLRHRTGDWYGLSVSWMRTDADCELGRFAGIVERTIQLLAP